VTNCCGGFGHPARLLLQKEEADRIRSIEWRPRGRSTSFTVSGPAGDGVPIISLKAPYDTASLFLGETQTLHYHRGGLYEWDGRAYPEADEAMLRSKLYGFLDTCRRENTEGEPLPVKPTAPMVSSVFDALRARAYLDSAVAPPAWLNAVPGPPADEIVVCTNGLLHLPTLKVLPHTPSFFAYNALDFAYQPAAPESKQFLAFLHQLCGEGKGDDNESIPGR
jgi:hypothetical protein